MSRKDDLKRLRQLAAKDWHKLTDAEREEESRLYTRVGPLPKSETRALTRAERAMFNRAIGRTGRPRVGAGAKRVLITVERSLLADADAFAKARGMSRSEMIAKGLARMMGRRAG